jgi:hypothetical protein
MVPWLVREVTRAFVIFVVTFIVEIPVKATKQ